MVAPWSRVGPRSAASSWTTRHDVRFRQRRAIRGAAVRSGAGEIAAAGPATAASARSCGSARAPSGRPAGASAPRTGRRSSRSARRTAERRAGSRPAASAARPGRASGRGYYGSGAVRYAEPGSAHEHRVAERVEAVALADRLGVGGAGRSTPANAHDERDQRRARQVEVRHAARRRARNQCPGRMNSASRPAPRRRPRRGHRLERRARSSCRRRRRGHRAPRRRAMRVRRRGGDAVAPRGASGARRGRRPAPGGTCRGRRAASTVAERRPRLQRRRAAPA